MRLVLSLSVGLLLLLGAIAGTRHARSARDISRLRLGAVIVVTFGLAWLSAFAELGLWALTGLSIVARPGKESEALLSMFLFAAPLEEGAKVLGVWPSYRSRRLSDVRHAVVYCAVAGAGFAAGKASSVLLIEPLGALSALRAGLCIVPHVASAVMWGATLGVRSRSSWFALAWLVATALRGGIDHIVFARGPGVMILGLPLLVTMLGLAYVFVRRASAAQAALAPIFGAAARRSASAAPWSEPRSVREIWHLLEPKHSPLMLRWVGIGTLVTAGVGMCMLALALYAGHAMGLDFAAADEADVRSNGPLSFLALAVGAAFPIAGYLVARASGTRSVLEPALGAALAVLGGVLFLSATTPLAAVFALALAPVAFVLASGGAWFGIAR